VRKTWRMKEAVQRLPTNENRFFRHIGNDESCGICYHSNEDCYHACDHSVSACQRVAHGYAAGVTTAIGREARRYGA
jgi:hypothetical protein